MQLVTGRIELFLSRTVELERLRSELERLRIELERLRIELLLPSRTVASRTVEEFLPPGKLPQLCPELHARANLDGLLCIRHPRCDQSLFHE